MKEPFFSYDKERLNGLSYIDKPYRIKQVIDFIINKKVYDFTDMSNIPKVVRQKFSECFDILDVQPIDMTQSNDGTKKFLFRTGNGLYIEAVYLKDKNKRITFCISSQSGCRMGCAFCRTSKMGLAGNLSYPQIISQVLFLSKVMADDPEVVDTAFNIVFMGMGEPLDNFDNLVKAIGILTDPDYFGMPQYRITVSTCGIMNMIKPLFEAYPGIMLALSLISASQEKRESVIPMAKKYKLIDMVKILDECHALYDNRITLEYVLIKGFNDSDDDIEELEMFRKDCYHLNIIPLNSNDETRPSETEIKEFMNKLAKSGFNATRRYRRGDDIKADCGQLYWEYI